ncbi:MAG: TonB family protein [Desulfuromonadaceae bacterium]
MNPKRKRHSDIILLLFILLSLLVHLLLAVLLPRQIIPSTPAEKKPVVVDLRRPSHLSRELDAPIRPELDKPRETPAKRLGPTNQRVEKEKAPKGKDFDDRTPRLATPTPQPQPEASASQPTRPAAQPAPSVKPSTQKNVELRRRPGKAGPLPLPSQLTPESMAGKNHRPPSPERLKSLDLMASANSAAINVSDRWRRKYRTEVEEGNTVWLDMGKDILISFFQRFRRNVEMVWGYPDQAMLRGQQGTCLLKITITRDGKVKDVVLKESSGYPLLDNEAIRAIRKGAPYGPLPKSYPREELNIMAFFQYEYTPTQPTRPRLY